MEMEMVVQKNFPGVNTVKHFLRSCILNGGTAGGIRIITMRTPDLTLGSYFKELRMTMSGNISRGPPNLNWSNMHVVMRLHFTSLARRGRFRPLATFSWATPKPTREDKRHQGGLERCGTKGRRTRVASDLGQFQSSAASIHISDSHVSPANSATVRAARYYIVVCRQLSFTIRHIYMYIIYYTHAYTDDDDD